MDITRRQLDRRLNRVAGIFELVIVLEIRFQPFEDLDGVRDGRLVDVDLLEATNERPILFEILPILFVCRRTDAAHRAGRQRRLQQIRGVHCAAGATSGGAMDASNLLKPALASGTVRCIGSTTYKEYRQYFEKDRALVRRFQKIDVNEPTIPDAIEILKGLKPYFEDYHKLKYTSDAIKAAVELSSRYIHDRKLPDKAIDVIDESGAAQMLLPENRRKRTIGLKEIETTIATMARIPPKAVSKDDAEVLRNLEETLKRVVYGQDKAIGA